MYFRLLFLSACAIQLVAGAPHWKVDLQRLYKKLHARAAQLEEEVYDWEIKIRKQDFEINELALKANDSKEKSLGKLKEKDKAVSVIT